MSYCNYYMYNFEKHAPMFYFTITYRKGCGCITQLSGGGGPSEQARPPPPPPPPQQQQLRSSAPRVRLTGSGKMPVVDMSTNGGGHPGDGGRSAPVGLPPKSPIYASVNKAKAAAAAATRNPQRRQLQQTKLHNYCNVGPPVADLLHLQDEKPTASHVYENSRAVLQRLSAKEGMYVYYVFVRDTQ